jgi:hypothetical protein
MSSSARSLKSQRLVLTAPKPRNPLVALAAQRKAGSHRDGAKTQRQKDAKSVRAEIKAL